MKFFDKSFPFKFRETCHHWIDYEILDALPEDFKEKYVNQFKIPELVFVPHEEKWIPKLHCYANHFDGLDCCRVDCSHCYPETLKELENIFGQTSCYKEKILINECEKKT